MDNPTPRQVIKLVETRQDLTPDERKKMLTLALLALVLDEPDKFRNPSRGWCIAIMWEQVQMVASSNGLTIPDIDFPFMIEAHEQYFEGCGSK